MPGSYMQRCETRVRSPRSRQPTRTRLIRAGFGHKPQARPEEGTAAPSSRAAASQGREATGSAAPRPEHAFSSSAARAGREASAPTLCSPLPPTLPTAPSRRATAGSREEPGREGRASPGAGCEMTEGRRGTRRWQLQRGVRGASKAIYKPRLSPWRVEKALAAPVAWPDRSAALGVPGIRRRTGPPAGAARPRYPGPQCPLAAAARPGPVASRK